MVGRDFLDSFLFSARATRYHQAGFGHGRNREQGCMDSCHLLELRDPHLVRYSQYSLASKRWSNVAVEGMDHLGRILSFRSECLLLGISSSSIMNCDENHCWFHSVLKSKHKATKRLYKIRTQRSPQELRTVHVLSACREIQYPYPASRLSPPESTSRRYGGASRSNPSALTVPVSDVRSLTR